MVRASTVALGVAGGLLAAVGVWSVSQRYTTERVPYTVVARVGDAELRRYPSAVLVETVAPSETEAFRRLFRYITGANDGGTDLSMTTPVSVRGRGTEISMTAPVETSADRDAIRMAFYLPAEYDIDSAPRPTAGDVEVVALPERTLAVRRFSWWPSPRRVARQRDRLIRTLEDAAVPVTGTPFFLAYDPPWTVPLLRRNEVAVEVEG